ncbi:MAG TPA: hypothetical protein VE464_12700 [Streptosporangiaceae bacterium]|jgi:hypothetical protein|nr:hypothetical protein [Streptosporangiaceae bacterium]
MLTEFYIPLSAGCFTLMGLWFIAVAVRQAEWLGSPLRRRQASAVATHFSLPGLMGLLALVNPDSGGLWRVSFGIAAGGGIVALIALRAPAAGKLGRAVYVAAIAAYVVIVILAIHPHIVGQLSFPIAPQRIAAVLLAGLVFAGVNVAWLLLFENAEPGSQPGGDLPGAHAG